MSNCGDSSDCGTSRRDVLTALGVGAGLILVPVGYLKAAPSEDPVASKDPAYDWTKHYWGYAIDTTRCIGCVACQRACRAENDVPEGYYRTWVERYTIDDHGEVRVDTVKDEKTGFAEIAPDGDEVVKSFFVPKMCNHCEKSVCNQVCPVGAAYRTQDGAVLVDTARCIGCGYCVQACPYGSRFINPKTEIADKCTLCYHRITKGMLPACVQACPKRARIFGDLKDPKSELSMILKQRRYRVMRPEMGTHPKCYYLGLDREVI